MEGFNFANLEAVVREYAATVEDLYKDKLLESERVATGKLIDSVRTKVVIGDNVYAVDVNLAECWKWVEYDTKPHWAPKGALIEWIKAKPVLPQPDSNGRIPTVEQLDYLIRRIIAGKGTKGSHDLRNTIEAVNEEFMVKIQEALDRDIGGCAEALIKYFCG